MIWSLQALSVEAQRAELKLIANRCELAARDVFPESESAAETGRPIFTLISAGVIGQRTWDVSDLCRFLCRKRRKAQFDAVRRNRMRTWKISEYRVVSCSTKSPPEQLGGL